MTILLLIPIAAAVAFALAGISVIIVRRICGCKICKGYMSPWKDRERNA